MRNMQFKCTLLDWTCVYALCTKIADEIRGSYNPDAIVAVARGGWYAGLVLSDFLLIKDLFSIKIEHWGMTAQPDKKASVKQPINVDLEGKKVLIVDDITDTGASMLLAIKHIEERNPEEVRTAALQHKISSTFKPDYYAEELGEWRWMIFPWNLNEDVSNLINRIRKEDIEVEEIEKELRKEFDLYIERKVLIDVLDRAF
jgi:hypothetical protein